MVSKYDRDSYSYSMEKDPILYRSAVTKIAQDFFKKKYPHLDLTDYETVLTIDSEDLVDVIHQLETGSAIELRRDSFDSQIAPQEMIVEDFKQLATSDRLLFVPKKRALDIIVRAIDGRAKEGHGSFTGTRGFPNTTTEDVILALEKAGIKCKGKEFFSRDLFMDRTQATIDEIMAPFDDFLKNPFKYKNPVVLKGKNNQPYAGLDIFRDQPITMIELLRGFYFGGNMDNFDHVRHLVDEIHRIAMGGGECGPVNVDSLRDHRINLTHLSQIRYSSEVSFLKDLPYQKRNLVLELLGVIEKIGWSVDDLPEEATWDLAKELAYDMRTEQRKIRNVYVRNASGKGVSDDTAIILAAFLPQTFTNLGHIETPYDAVSRMLGAYLADMIDTLEKQSYLIFDSGQDETAAEYVQKRFRYLCQTNREFRETFNIRRRTDDDYKLINEATLVDFVAAAANDQEVLHSSQRYFLKEDQGDCALGEYFKYLKSMFATLGLEYEAPVQTPPEDMRTDMFVTFERRPIRQARAMMTERINLILNNSERRDKIKEHYNRST